MKIIIAGATGAIGRPLIRLLSNHNHDVYGITQSPTKIPLLEQYGAHPIVLDVLNREEVLKQMKVIKPDVVIDMLTSLPKEYTPAAMRAAAPRDAQIRIEGGANLLQAAELYHVERYIAQSAAFWYAPRPGLADENAPFAIHATPGISAGVKNYMEIERRTLQAKLEGIPLRFGFFYGPGTWFNPDGNMADQVKNQKFPIIGNGDGFWNFVHIEDAAQAILLALGAKPDVYNIVNDQPSQLKEWLPAFARFVGAPAPLHLTDKEGETELSADSVYYATKLRAASNTKAKRDLLFKPRPFEWLECFKQGQ